MIRPGIRTWRRRGLFGPVRAPVPDVLIDFATGRGIPVANGGAGGRGSELVTVTAPVSGAAFYRRRKEAYDPAFQGYPLFELKPANQLVGWGGPRSGGYWTGPMPALSSLSETVAVYSSTTGLTVTPVAGGVVGPDAIRLTLGAGYGGSGGYAVSPYRVHDVSTDVGQTCFYAHAVVEVFSHPELWQPRFVLRDITGNYEMRSVVQPLVGPDTSESGVVARGTGPHGGALYEVWAAMPVLTLPPVSLGGLIYLAHAPGNTEPMDMIVHGVQSHFLVGWRSWPLAGLPPMFSYARGVPVVWTPERFSIAHTQDTMTIGMRLESNLMPSNQAQYNVLYARNGSFSQNTIFQQDSNGLLQWRVPHESINATHPPKFVARTGSSRQRAVTLDGANIQSLPALDAFTSAPETIDIGAWQGDSYGTGRFRRVLFYSRALSDAEMLQAFGGL